MEIIDDIVLEELQGQGLENGIQKPEPGMYVTKFTAHLQDCGAGQVKKRRMSASPLNYRDIGVLLLPHVQQNPKFAFQAASGIMAEFTTTEPSPSKIYNGLAWAKGQVRASQPAGQAST